MFAVKIFTINYYLTRPESELNDRTYSDFRCAEIKQVPILRIFGSTSEGQKTCLHMHNVYPYLLVKLKPFKTTSELNDYLFEFSNQIDKILNVALCIRENTQHVFKMEPLMTKSMYGYHEKDSLYCKIYLFNPALIKKLSDLLINATIMSESFQTYESHVPFNLQFLMDYNLFGMNYIYLSRVKFRRQSISSQIDQLEQTNYHLENKMTKNTKWNLSNLDENLLINETIERQSMCELELDASAEDILNTTMDKNGYMLNPGLSALWEEESNRRKQAQINTEMETPDYEERTNFLKIDNEIEFRNRLVSLLETRFEEKYPFNKPANDIKSNENDEDDYNQAKEINDDSILNILDSLHNSPELDNSLLDESQLNEEDKEAIRNENIQMTQIVVESVEVDKLNESIENENFFNQLNKSPNTSASSLDEDDDHESDNSKNEDLKLKFKSQEINKKPMQTNLIDECLNNSSSSSSSSDEDDGNEANINLNHFCSYFESEDTNLPMCSHLNLQSQQTISQKTCLLCDHKNKLEDSLNYMSYTSPVKSNNIIDLNELKFDSPTLNDVKNNEEDVDANYIIDETLILEDEEDDDANNKTIKNESIVNSSSNKSLKENLDVEDENESNYSRLDRTRSSQSSYSSQSRRSSQSMYESIMWSSDSDNEDSNQCLKPAKVKFESNELKEEIKRKNAIESIEEYILKEESDFIRKISNKKVNAKCENVLRGSNEKWFCPKFDPPLPSDLNETFSDTINSNAPIVQYFKKDKKFKVKLNLVNMDNRIELNEEVIGNNDGNDELKWFTPAIPLPSVKRIKQKIKSNERKLKLEKLNRLNRLESKLSQSSDAITSNSTKVSQSINEEMTNPTFATKSEQIKSTQLKSILNKTLNESQVEIAPTKKSRKSVRFNEQTQFLNENSVFKEPQSKGHFIVQDLVNSYDDSNLIIKSKSRQNSQADVSSIDSNETLLYDYDELNNTTLTANKQSFFEYESILMPKTSKYLDCLEDMSCIIEKDESISSSASSSKEVKKESKKEKKIIQLPVSEVNYLTLMSMELHVNTRGNLTPNPEEDSIGFICFTIYNQRPTSQFNENEFENHLIINDHSKRSLATERFLNLTNYSLNKRFKTIKYVYKEEDLFPLFIEAIKVYDPDLLIGFEVQKLSWCFLAQRAIKLKQVEFCSQISRLPKMKRESFMRINKRPDQQQQINIIQVPQELIIAGRVVLNLWRIFRSEITLNIYTFENCCFHILKERTPKYTNSLLTSWFINHTSDLNRWKTIEYYLYRTMTNLRLINSLDLVGKTSEFAKVYGIEFYHVLSRGSQFRVESMMLRIARKLNFIALSANQRQKTLMRAPECIPLTLEPESKFYTDPIAVLDFQSLYPSVIIAFNICFTTCLGRIESIGKEGSFKFGCSSLFVPDSLIKSLNFAKDIYIAPNGVAFVKKHIRTGILPVLLEDILKTRVMVKNSMKLYKEDLNLQKIFDSRQLSLKLIANVTFGYTAANYSGRMPCVEVGDTIVRVARQCLENSIKYIHNNFHRFGGRVCYGDTDSLFVLFEKIQKTDAFEKSYTIVDEITKMFPKPLKLKFEKIYYPSILLAKKRYIGYMFETPQQSEPVLDAKGIEIIRRDGCQIAAKILEKCIKILFEFKDTNKVKDYVIKQCIKLPSGKINLKDFIIAKEYRGRDTYDNAKSIAACQIANRSLVKDPLSEPLTCERVPYLIVCGRPNQPLYELVRSPEELMQNNDLKLNYEYYVMKQILPPLDRIMCLMKINVFDWIKNVSFRPKIFKFTNDYESASSGKPTISISNFIYSTDCVLCGKKRESSQEQLCSNCKKLDQVSLYKLRLGIQKSEKKMTNFFKLCQICTGAIGQNYFNFKPNECVSTDCPNNFLLLIAKQEFKQSDFVRKTIDEYF